MKLYAKKRDIYVRAHTAIAKYARFQKEMVIFFRTFVETFVVVLTRRKIQNKNKGNKLTDAGRKKVYF